MTIFDNLKSVAKVLQEAGKIEQYKQILEAQEKLLEMQKIIADLENENKELRNKLEIKENLVYENNTYWTKRDDKKDGPYCSCCWDSEKKIIRMHPSGNPAFYYCPNCKGNSVKIDPNYRPPYVSRKSPENYI